MCNDQVVLAAVQNIIQNMLATEDPSQQQLHFLQSCGFGGLWRFAGPFPKVGIAKYVRVFYMNIVAIKNGIHRSRL